ncbi:MAG: hypothetical protein AAGG51_08560 [Cyanobacteria bacterium P01_G01_bin.54]
MSKLTTRQILEKVRHEYDLMLNELLRLLQQRLGGIAASQLAISAGCDISAFNKIINGEGGRFLHHDQIESMITDLVNQDLLPKGSFNNADSEVGIWLMVLQSAAAAEAHLAYIKKHNQTASDSHYRIARKKLVLAMRESWIETDGGIPKLGPPRQDKFILSWREIPKDLDLHLLIQTDKSVYRVSYRSKGQKDGIPWAILDDDIRTGFGPETIYVRYWLKANYYIAVHNYSNDIPLFRSGAVVEFAYFSDITTFECPTKGNGRWWNILSIDINRNIKVINQIGDCPFEIDSSRISF